MRPINNVVDASNYLMLELGQPSHPYDLATLGRADGGLPAFRVRRARDGVPLTTLDDVERPVTEPDLLPCDAAHVPAAIAGITGGAGRDTPAVPTYDAWGNARFAAITNGKRRKNGLEGKK